MARVDSDREEQGIQELKEWMGVMDYIRSFPDTNGDNIPDVPEKYRGKQGRILVRASRNPINLIRRGSYITWISLSIALVILMVAALAWWLTVRRIWGWRH